MQVAVDQLRGFHAGRVEQREACRRRPCHRRCRQVERDQQPLARVLRTVVVVGMALFCAVMTYFSILYVWATRFQTTAATDIPIAYIYTTMPIGFVLMLLHLAFVARGYISAGRFEESDEMDAESAASL